MISSIIAIGWAKSHVENVNSALPARNVTALTQASFRLRPIFKRKARIGAENGIRTDFPNLAD
jgi:hypothetical protein